MTTIIPGKTALVQVTHSWHTDTDIRTQEQSIRAELRSLSGAENGAERVKNSRAEQSESQKKTSRVQSGRSRNGGGAVSGLYLPLMPLKPAVLCTICTQHFLEAKRSPGPAASRLDFGGNRMTFLVCPHFHNDDQSWSLCNVCIHYTLGPISSIAFAGLSLQSTLCLRKEVVTRLFLLQLCLQATNFHNFLAIL